MHGVDEAGVKERLDGGIPAAESGGPEAENWLLCCRCGEAPGAMQPDTGERTRCPSRPSSSGCRSWSIGSYPAFFGLRDDRKRRADPTPLKVYFCDVNYMCEIEVRETMRCLARLSVAVLSAVMVLCGLLGPANAASRSTAGEGASLARSVDVASALESPVNAEQAGVKRGETPRAQGQLHR